MAGVTAAVNLAVAAAWLTVIGRGVLPYAMDGAGNLVLAGTAVPRPVYVWTTLITLGVVGLRSLLTTSALRAGGAAVARMAGGVVVNRGTADPDARRLLNVVDEMAIASGVAVPQVYVVAGEPKVNAFAAGYGPNEAAITVTEGALRQLTRDELQGVIAHEFSHVLNGDMRLNVRMIGVLAGLLFLGEIGQFLVRATADNERGRRSRSGSGVALFGVVLTIIGLAGLVFGRLIKAAVSREREFLADASAVQFTRNPEGLAGALAVIDAAPDGSRMSGRHTETLSHLFFASGINPWWPAVFATHPPLSERIRRIDGRFVAAEYLARRARRSDGPMVAVPPAPDRDVAATAARDVPTRATAGPTTSGPTRRAATLTASIGRPTAEHVRHAARLLAELPPPVRDAVAGAGAPALVLAFALDPDDLRRKEQLGILDRAGRRDLAAAADTLAAHVRTLAPGAHLPVVSLALGTLRGLDQAGREALVSDLRAVVDADGRVTLHEFVLLTLVQRHLDPTAGASAVVKYQSIVQVQDDARLTLALLADAGQGAAPSGAFGRGLAVLGLAETPVPPRVAPPFTSVTKALDRLRQLAPFVKQRFMEACVATVSADQRIALAEAELVRAIAAVLDCPVPPLLDEGDP